MKKLALFLSVIVFVCTIATGQQPTASETAASIPPLVRYSGVLTDSAGKPLTGVQGVTFALYRGQQGGAALWLETQNVNADAAGHYTVVLGSASANGLPAGLFSSGEARWLGVQAAGQNEQARVLLLSVPYAMKAGDAETIGGLPASAFVLAMPQTAATALVAQPAAGAMASATSCAALASDGTALATQVGKFTAPCQIEGSEITDTGTAVGIGTTAPAAKLDVNGTAIVRGAASLNGGASANGLNLPATGAATSLLGKNSFPLKFATSSFNGPSAIAVPQTFQWMAEPVGNNTSAPSGKLNLLFGTGTNAPAETGLSVSSKGIFTFAAGQKFPGTGTVSSVSMSAPASDFVVSGTPVTGKGTLALAWKVAPSSADNANAIVKRDASGNFAAGAITAASFAGSGAGLTNVNAAMLGGNPPSAFTQTNVSNAYQSTPGGTPIPQVLGPVNTASSGAPAFNSNSLDFTASVFNSTAAAAQNQVFRWQAEPVGGNTANPSATLNLLFGANGAPPTETGFSISPNGQVALGNNETVTGNVSASQLVSTVAQGTAPLQVTSTTQVANLNASLLGGLPASSFVAKSGDTMSGALQIVPSTATDGLVSVVSSPVFGVRNAGRLHKDDVTGGYSFAALEAVHGGTDGEAAWLALTNSNAFYPVLKLNKPSGAVGAADFLQAWDFSGNEYFAVRSDGSITTAGGITGKGNISIGGSITTNGTINAIAGMTTGGSITANGTIMAPSYSGSSGTVHINGTIQGAAGADGGAGIAVTGGTGTSGNGGTGITATGGTGASGFQGGTAIVAFAGTPEVHNSTAGVFGLFSHGDIYVTETLTANAKFFKIDHPLYPAEKYLQHASVESSEMMNIYTGNVALDGSGAATVKLPEWFEAENGDFRYSLTAIGAPAPGLYIAKEVGNGSFQIAGGQPGMKVSWQITAVRQDPYAKAKPLVVELDKSERERGFYIHPEYYGATEEKGIEWGLFTQEMKQMREAQQKQAAAMEAHR